MIDFEIKGAIFDVDDTLLDNSPNGVSGGLHEQSRIVAVKKIGNQYDIPYMANITQQQNIDAFTTAKSHSIEGAVWNIMTHAGLVSGEVDRNNALLHEVVALKDELHDAVMAAEGIEVTDASWFVKSLSAHGLEGRLAIASSGTRHNIDTFLTKITDLAPYFEDRIQSRETVTNFKPDPEGFNSAFVSLQLPDEDRAKTLAFEDDPRGVDAAHAAGLFTCAITTRYSREDFEKMATPPQLIAGSFREFAEILGIPLHP
jgi:beta-phosphoglucomutase-like phosphatase (HAD superfamily)